MDFLDARSVNRWARRVVGATLVVLVGVVVYNLTNQEASPPASTVLGAQLTTTLPLGVGGDADAAGVLADFLASLNQEDATTTGTTVADSTTTSTAQSPPSSTTSSTADTTTTTGSPSTTSTTTTRRPTTTTTRLATTTTRPPTATTTPATTTTTTLPSTTTTTITVPPTTTTVAGPLEMYISSLVPGGLLGGALWEPSVQVRIALTGTGSRRDIQVTGQWTGAYSATVSGSTAPNGRVTFWAPPIADDSLVFTVTSISHTEYLYNPALDGVTQVTVTRADAF